MRKLPPGHASMQPTIEYGAICAVLSAGFCNCYIESAFDHQNETRDGHYSTAIGMLSEGALSDELMNKKLGLSTNHRIK